MSDLPTFSFEEHSFDHKTGTGVFTYEITRNGETFRVSDTIVFDSNAIGSAPAQHPEIFRALLENLHIALGVSYWKLFCPPNIIIKPFSLNRIQAQFWNTVYTKGLGEFFYRNGIDYRGLVDFPSRESSSPAEHSVVTPDRSLSLLGGGKDSVVTAEFLKEHRIAADLFAVNPNEIHTNVAEIAKMNLLSVSRKLDPILFTLNQRNDAYNGHVPISSIYAWIGLTAAFLYGYRYVIASNEKSANFGNVEYLGQVINHQWSKSYEFESMLSEYVSQFVMDGISYFSLLRPLSEFEITGRFCAYPEYYSDVTSCNAAFTIHNTSPGKQKWCGECPKCAFMYLMLSAYLPQSTVEGMFGKHVFSNGNLTDVYKQLFGVSGHKPFECVGTPQECVLAFKKMVSEHQQTDIGILKNIVSEMKQNGYETIDESGSHNAFAIPDQFSAILKLS